MAANTIGMTPNVTQSFGANVSESKKQPSFSSFLEGQFKIGGLFGDFATALKLTNFWTESLTGSVTESSRKMTEAGGILKSYIGTLEFPSKVGQVKKHLDGLSRGTAESVMEFANSIFAAGKSVFDGAELGAKFNFFSKEFVAKLSPLSPMGGFSFAATELTLRTIPEFLNSETVNEKISSVMKVAKQVALLVVGALGLVASFFKAVAAPVVIPTLLTAFVTLQISGRFFDALIKNA